MARPRSGIRLRQRPDTGGWEIVGHHPVSGEKIRVQCGTRDELEAKTFHDQFLAGIASSSVMAPTTRLPLIRDLMESYERDKLPRVNSKATFRQNVKHLTRHIGNLELVHINTRTIAEYVDRRRGEAWSRPHSEGGTTISDVTIRRELGELRTALNWGWNGDRRGWFGSHGLPTFDMPVSSQSQRRERWITKEEAVKLIEHAAPHIALFISIALETAARKEAVESLTWGQVDFDHHIIDFGAGRGNKRRPKVEVTDDLMAELRLAFESRTTDRVIEFGGHSGRHQKSNDGGNKRGAIDTKRGLYKAAVRAGFVTGNRVDKHGKVQPETDITAHILKHSAITWMVRAGMSYEDIAFRAQTTPEMIRKHYGHHDPRLSATARNAVSFLHMRKRA